VKFRRAKNLVAVWLFALFLNAFSIAVVAEIPDRPAELVYCPLTKRLQPVKARKKEVWKNPLENICADESEKNLLAAEIFGTHLLKTNFLDEEKFEGLVFDFFRKGAAALAQLPKSPGFPQKNSVKTFSIAFGFSQTDEIRFIWKLSAENFSFAQNGRPPNPVSVKLFEFQNSSAESKKLPRRSAPRAPPFLA
jgi:hypothetical protein